MDRRETGIIVTVVGEGEKKPTKDKIREGQKAYQATEKRRKPKPVTTEDISI